MSPVKKKRTTSARKTTRKAAKKSASKAPKRAKKAVKAKKAAKKSVKASKKKTAKVAKKATKAKSAKKATKTKKTARNRSYGRQGAGKTIKSLSLDQELVDKAEAMAKDSGVSFSQFVNDLLAAKTSPGSKSSKKKAARKRR